MALKFPPIPEPSPNEQALYATAKALKETSEIMSGVRGDRGLSSVTWQDLVDLGLILPTQVPVTPSNR